MNAHGFDLVARSLTGGSSRRGLLGGLVAATCGIAAGRLPDATAGKKRKQPKANTFGCVNVGKACRKAKECCSGICEGKKDKKTCRAHDTGGCEAGAATNLCGGSGVSCTTSTGASGGCETTTGNAGYCRTGGVWCKSTPCRKDVDCRSECGPDAACIRCPGTCGDTETVCAGLCET